MTPGGSPEQSSVERKVVGGEVPRVPDYHRLEESAVCPKDIVTTGMQ